MTHLKNNERKLFIDEIQFDYETGHILKKIFALGDKIIFLPCIYLDFYETTSKNPVPLSHVISNIYEFTFKPVKRFKNEQHGGCYHYLIEVENNFTVFHFNWLNKYEKYLQLGQLYKGYGTLRCSAGDPSTENKSIDPLAIEPITKKAVLNKIIVEYTNQWGDTETPFSKLGYPVDFEHFKSVCSSYQPVRTLLSTKDKNDSDQILFEVDLY
ncbi:hypothetical protein [Desulfobacula sp.]|uniref:hypothetical protein n=1 Tax=Desulfobacula sp. TaxID=2593537 RepID=UPI0025B831B6|nr:hypothetical protein [Desulfobacula sp.]MBC2704289.1 hypothetical protein [Desulfobacula sp.]